MLNDDVEVKQRYLREEILDKGYDADKFTLWIDQTKEKGSLSWSSGCELENWTIEELGDVVREYQLKNKPKNGDHSTNGSSYSPGKGSSSTGETVEYSSVHSTSIPVRANSNY